MIKYTNMKRTNERTQSMEYIMMWKGILSHTHTRITEWIQTRSFRNRLFPKVPEIEENDQNYEKTCKKLHSERWNTCFVWTKCIVFKRIVELLCYLYTIFFMFNLCASQCMWIYIFVPKFISTEKRNSSILCVFFIVFLFGNVKFETKNRRKRDLHKRI